MDTALSTHMLVCVLLGLRWGTGESGGGGGGGGGGRDQGGNGRHTNLILKEMRGSYPGT